MKRAIYIHQQKEWPNFYWNTEELLATLSDAHRLQGKLMGKMEALGFKLSTEASLETISLDVIKSSEIEGEKLNDNLVRSSVAKRLGMDISGLLPIDRNIDGVVEMMMDATQQFKKQLNAERLFAWHSALFPTGRVGMTKITVGNWRKTGAGPMQVVSGAMGKEKVHFEAPESALVKKEMAAFIKWFNAESTIDPILKAGVAHLWFLTIHPFDDGNGRIARALTDLQLARADNSKQRYYSMSAQIRLSRKGYYELLEASQKGSLDITPWLTWFLNCLVKALHASDKTLATVLNKANFWKAHTHSNFNTRQKNILNKLFDNFDGKLNTSKYAKINKCSADTALRDIQDLINKNALAKEASGGRSTNYVLAI